MGIDLNDMSLKTFAKNFPGALAHGGDLHQVASIIAAIKMRGGINVIAASSPCQPHSPSTPKSSLIPDDPRAQLTLRIAEIVVGVMPKVFVLENVAGLLKSRYGYWTKAKDLLRKHGYNVSWSVIDAAKVGVPQHRRRLLVVATLDFSVDVPAASTILADRPDTTVRDKLPWLGDYYYHYSRDNRSSCVRSSDTACPTLRTNCHHFPAKYIPRPSDRGRPFSKCRKYNKHDLAALSGWPPDAWLPDSLKDTMFILGNCVPPPMMAWLFNLVSNAASKALDTEMARLDENVARYCSIALPTADLSAFDGAAAIDLQGMAVQAIFDKYDLSRPGAYTPPIQGTLDPWLLSHDRAVPDVDSNVTGVHLAQLQRRERLRTSVLLRTKTRSDGSTRDLREPVWNAPPPDVPPSSSNPTGMFGARPYVRVPDVDSKLHGSSHVSAKHAHWAAAHVTHCQRCIEYSTAVVGTPPPIFSIQAAHVTGQTPDPKSFVLCPGCYQLGMLADIKEGFDPRIEPAPDPVKIENGGSCFDEWDQTLSYMLKLDALGCMAEGVWSLPKGAVVSALHVVTRPSDMRRFKRDGTPYAVRTVLDLTKSQVNAAQKRWRFRLEGADGAVRLIGETGHKYLGACDISKYFPSIGLHPRAQQFCWIKDPRASTTWGGRGKPTASWLKFQAERKASGVRIPPYRRCTGMPLGLALAPAFACSLAAEIVQILTAMGIKAVQYVDDALVSGSTIIECQCNMDTAMSVLRWLGFTCNAAKTTGPSTCLKFIGYEFDTVAGTIAIGQERKEELISLLHAAISTKQIDTRDLETLIGKLGYTASVMRGARAFIYRMRVAHRVSAKAGLKHTRLGPAPIADMTWWLKQLKGPWSGSRIFVKGADLPVLKMKSDASGGGGPEAATLGWGYQLGRAIHWQRWDPSTAVVEEQHIQWKELLAISHVCTEYGHLFANSILRCSVDNSGVQYIVNKLSSSCPTLMHLLRIIADAQCRHNFDIVASHVSQQLRVASSTAAGYSAKVRQFYKFCSVVGLAAVFIFHQMATFFQWYVGGFKSLKCHAYTTCPQYISAWRDHCDYVGLEFPDKGSATIRRLNKFINALGKQFPHKPKQDLALTINLLARVAAFCGIHCTAHLWSVDVAMLCHWARCMCAHSLFLRGCEHKFGARRSDIVYNGDGFSCTVGSRPEESKYEGRPRVLSIVLGAQSHLDPGTVLDVFLRRVHCKRGVLSRAKDAPLFPAITNGLIRTRGETSKNFLAWVSTALAATCVAGKIGESSFRAGGATDAFAQGASDEDVRTRGDWRTDAFRRYNRPTIELQRQRQHALLQARSTSGALLQIQQRTSRTLKFASHTGGR